MVLLGMCVSMLFMKFSYVKPSKQPPVSMELQPAKTSIHLANSRCKELVTCLGYQEFYLINLILDRLASYYQLINNLYQMMLVLALS